MAGPKGRPSSPPTGVVDALHEADRMFRLDTRVFRRHSSLAFRKGRFANRELRTRCRGSSS